MSSDLKYPIMRDTEVHTKEHHGSSLVTSKEDPQDEMKKVVAEQNVLSALCWKCLKKWDFVHVDGRFI